MTDRIDSATHQPETERTGHERRPRNRNDAWHTSRHDRHPRVTHCDPPELPPDSTASDDGAGSNVRGWFRRRCAIGTSESNGEDLRRTASTNRPSQRRNRSAGVFEPPREFKRALKRGECGRFISRRLLVGGWRRVGMTLRRIASAEFFSTLRDFLTQQAKLSIKICRAILGFSRAQSPNSRLAAADPFGDLSVGHIERRTECHNNFVCCIHVATIRE